MPKGFFSQGVCLLTDGSTTIAGVKSVLETAGIPIAREIAASEQWSFSGPAVLVPFRREVNGAASVDVVDRPWPDGMANPKTDMMTFGAWSMWYFGPFTYPGGLERSIQQSWSWPAAKQIAPTHRGFIRVRISYVGGADKDAPVLPKDYDPAEELMFLNRLVVALGKTPGVICCFNPNGEVLRDLPSFQSISDECLKQGKLPLLLWMNVRLFHIDNTIGLMDSVGNKQLDMRDVEVVYPRARYDPNAIGNYIGNVSHYLLDLGREIQTGEAIDGPGETELSWTAESRDKSLAAPPRPVLRLYPKADADAIGGTLAAMGI